MPNLDNNVTSTMNTVMPTQMMNVTGEPENTTNGSSYSFYPYDYSGTYILTAITVLMVGVNPLVFVAIVTNSEIRKKSFYWTILNLCVWDLLMGIFFLPLLLKYDYTSTWQHGDAICRWWVIMDFSHIVVSASCVIGICMNRTLAKVRTTKPFSERTVMFFNIAALASPWILLFVLCLPFILSSERHLDAEWMSEMCFMFIRGEHYIAIIVVLFSLPVVFLSIFVSAILVVYICFEGNWDKIDDDQGSPTSRAETESLRMSTLACWTIGVLTILTILPITILDCVSISCFRGCCMVTWESYNATYVTYLSRGAITPWFYLMIPEFRKVVKDLIQNCKEKVFNLRRSGSTQFIYRKQDE